MAPCAMSSAVAPRRLLCAASPLGVCPPQQLPWAQAQVRAASVAVLAGPHLAQPWVVWALASPVMAWELHLARPWVVWALAYLWHLLLAAAAAQGRMSSSSALQSLLPEAHRARGRRPACSPWARGGKRRRQAARQTAPSATTEAKAARNLTAAWGQIYAAAPAGVPDRALVGSFRASAQAMRGCRTARVSSASCKKIDRATSWQSS